MNSKYMTVSKATIQRDDLLIVFQRLHIDGRDQMCDSVAPQWEPADKFIVTMEKLRTWTETESLDHLAPGAKMETRHTESIDRFEFRGISRELAARIWLLGARYHATFDQIKESIPFAA